MSHAHTSSAPVTTVILTVVERVLPVADERVYPVILEQSRTSMLDT
jgi:hypothetical protein